MRDIPTRLDPQANNPAKTSAHRLRCFPEADDGLPSSLDEDYRLFLSNCLRGVSRCAMMRQSEPFRRLQACSVSSQQVASIARKGSQRIEGATFGATPRIENPENDEIPHFPVFLRVFSMTF